MAPGAWFVMFAGMPSIGLSELGRLRLESISFFLLGLVVAAGVVRGLWNSLQRDFPRLPRLTFGKALTVVVLWGLLFVVVLTMISGARELMTPGAWQKQGWTYRLAGPPPTTAALPPVDTAAIAARKQRLRELWRDLARYALAHEGRFPPQDHARSIAAERWNLPDLPGAEYLYVAGRSIDQSDAVLAYEPQVFDDQPFVLLASGELQRMSAEALRALLAREAGP